jgi:hypothetical protein
LEGERKNMNTVKRWLAGFLSFAMIFTSAAFSNVGAVVTFAANNAIVVTTDDGVKNYATGALTDEYGIEYPTLFDRALAETAYWYTGEDDPNYQNELKAPTITLNEDAVVVYPVVSIPLIIDLNGKKLEDWEDLRPAPGYCESDTFNEKAYPTMITFAEHNAETVYNWVFSPAKNPAWYVKTISYICPNCGLNNDHIYDEDDLDASTVGTTRYNADKNRYEFVDKNNPNNILSTHTSDVVVDGWYMTVDPYIVAVNGSNQHDDNNLPIVKALLTRISTGEEKLVDVEVTPATETEINEAIKRNIIAEGNTAATCETGGAIVYKATVKDPDGKELNTTYVRDAQATEKLEHVKGAIVGLQFIRRSAHSYVSANAAKKAGEQFPERYVGVIGKDNEYYCLYWTKVRKLSGDIKAADVVETIPDNRLARFMLKDDGSFTYRVVYECDTAKSENHQPQYLYGDGVEVKPCDNAATEAEAKDGKHSVCISWLYDNKTEPCEFTNGTSKVNRKLTIVFGSQFKRSGFSHIQESGSYKKIIDSTCQVEGEAQYECAICHAYVGGGLDEEGKTFLERHNPVATTIEFDQYDSGYAISMWSGYSIPRDIYLTAPMVKNEKVVEDKCFVISVTSAGEYICKEADIYGDVAICNLGTEEAPNYVAVHGVVTLPKLNHNATAVWSGYQGAFDKDDPNTYPTAEQVSGVEGDRRKVVMSADGKTASLESDCVNPGGTYNFCLGVPQSPVIDYEEAHWVPVTVKEPKGHTFVQEVSTGDWKAYEVRSDGSLRDITGDAGAFDFDDENDYTYTTTIHCTTCNTNEKVTYHYADGVDGIVEEGNEEVMHIYNAIDVVTERAGADCQTMRKTIYTVKGLTYQGGGAITHEYEIELTPNAHKYEVASWNWADDYESATITGDCTVEGCNAADAHPGSDIATVTQTTGTNGITTFTATYKDQTDVKTAYSLKNAVVDFDTSGVVDANLVAGVEDYTSPKEEGPAVTVTVNGTVIDPSLYNVEWYASSRLPVMNDGVEALREGNGKAAGKGVTAATPVLNTAKLLIAVVSWNEEALDPDVEVLCVPDTEYPYPAVGWKNAPSNKLFDGDAKVYETKNGKTEKIKNQIFDYNPEKSYSVVATALDSNGKEVKDATIKYAVTDKRVSAYKSEQKEDEWLVQKKIEALDYDLDEVTGLKDAGDYYVYAQVSAEGYTAYTGLIKEVHIVPQEVDVNIDNVTAIEGTQPVFTLETKIDGEVVVIDPSEYTFKTLGGAELTTLTPGTYKVQMVSNNYIFSNNEYSDYVFVLEVVSMDDSTATDQAKAKAIGDQIDALGENPTEADVAAARAAYDKLSDAAKARISPETLKKLTDAEEAIQVQKDADAAVTAAKPYETDAAVKAALDALTAALAKGDTAEIKAATTNLNTAITNVKEAAAAKDAANAAINGAKGYESNADVKAALDALNAALAKGDTAAIKTATTNLNNAVTKAKQPAPAPAKSASKITFSTKSKSIKASKVKKKAQKFQIKIKKTGNGKVTYKKSSGSKKLSVSKSGKITVKKGTKKGTYKIKVKATIAETSTFKKATKSQTIKVKVK